MLPLAGWLRDLPVRFDDPDAVEAMRAYVG
jgi:hypothetical protein